MDILTHTKEELDAQFGIPMFAQALIGGFQIESAWSYDFGGTLRLRVGFYNNVARYSCFEMRTLEQFLRFTPQEVQACLDSIVPIAKWSTNAPSTPAPDASSTVTTYGCTEG